MVILSVSAPLASIRSPERAATDNGRRAREPAGVRLREAPAMLLGGGLQLERRASQPSVCCCAVTRE